MLAPIRGFDFTGFGNFPGQHGVDHNGPVGMSRGGVSGTPDVTNRLATPSNIQEQDLASLSTAYR